MRVAMSSFRFNDEGGIERASYELARRLAGDIDLSLVATDVSPAPDAPLSWVPVPASRAPGFLTPVTYSAAATRALAGRPFDLLHNQGGCALRAQDVITAHSCHRAWWRMKFRNGEGARALANPHHHAILAVERANYRPGAFRRVIAVSRGVGREVVENYGVPAELVTVIPNAVDTARFQPADAADRRARIRARHGLTDDDVALLFVGKEFRRKGLAPLIDALPGLPAHAKALVVGGDDPEPFRARARAAGVADRVIFAGHSREVQDYFQAGDVFVFPTLYEAFALVSLEAAAAGLPLVATEVNGTEDFVRPGENGFFAEREGGSLARTLAPLVADRDLRRRLGAQARADAAEYTWERVASRTLEVYREVVAAKRRA
jgi:UDP-glucose:(heptosyl)LPS alpha-1,3-glucosyltransferase